tara:strand:+ start:1383 stop:1631 length:249 start_codon:yes stop_codon:yes gene_type:complete
MSTALLSLFFYMIRQFAQFTQFNGWGSLDYPAAVLLWRQGLREKRARRVVSFLAWLLAGNLVRLIETEENYHERHAPTAEHG